MNRAFILFCLTLITAGCSSVSSGANNHVTLEPAPAWDQQQDELTNLVNKVHKEWNRNITMSQVKPPPGTTVRINVRFYSDGGEATLLSIKGGTKKARRACARALLKSSSEWSPKMVETLGTQQTLTFTFVYS